MKLAILLSTVAAVVAVGAYGFTEALVDVSIPSGKQIGAALALSEDKHLQEAGARMAADGVAAPALLGLPCKSSHKAVGPCDVSFKVCPHVHHFHIRYRSTACASGICVDSSDTKSGEGAAKDSLYKLMLRHPQCACGAANTTIGSCRFDLNTCFQLDSACTTPAFYSSATCTKNAVSADFCCAATGEEAAKGAMTALSNKMNIQASCL